MLIIDRFVTEWNQYHLGYALQGVFFVPVHEMAHYHMAKILGVPTRLNWDSIYYEHPGIVRDLMITLAPTMFAIFLLIWSICAFALSLQTTSSLMILTLQSGYAIAHFPLCTDDWKNTLMLLNEAKELVFS